MSAAVPQRTVVSSTHHPIATRSGRYVRFEGDVSDGEIFITAGSANDALRRAIEKVQLRIVPEG